MDKTARTKDPLAHIKVPLRLTLLGLWLEALAAAFWPLISVVLVGGAALSFRALNLLPLDLAWIALLALVCAALAALWYAARHFQMPSAKAAVARLDAGLDGAPLAMLHDAQAIGAQDANSVAVWQAHRARMAKAIVGLRAVPPHVRLSAADPFALRYVALLVATLAALFGAPLHMDGVAQGGTSAPATPLWEAWATPPAYTGKPTLYLADQTGDTLTLPVGTKIDLRLYGDVGDVILDETVSARTDATQMGAAAQSFVLAQSGVLNFKGQGGRDFAVTALPDTAPTIAATGDVARKSNGRFALAFTAADDYAITSGRAEITLDLPKVRRDHGLAAQPDNAPSVVVDLPLPRRGGRIKVTETLIDDLSKTLLANQPVVITLQALDGAGNTGSSAALHTTLPAKRFFDPLAAAIVEMRRDVLWARANAPRAAQILKAVTSAPEGFVRDERAYLRLRAVIAALDAGTLSDVSRETLAEEMWQIAILVEEGDLKSAKERLDRAQDRLDEAIRKGAAPEEVAELMQELQDALRNYMRQLAEEQRERGDDVSREESGPTISADQLQQMMQRLQELIEQGKSAEAAELMQQLRDLMENMRVVEGQGSGEGEGGTSGQAMRELGNNLRGQQDLSDDAFRDMQQGGDGQSQGDEGAGTLAERQENLRRQLDDLQQGGQLPGAGTAPGEAGRSALDDAARAMEDAEDALKNGDLPRALDGQAEAMQALREGMSNFGEALAQEQRQASPSQNGQALDEPDQEGRDPLGRQAGNALRHGSDGNLPQGEDVRRRADELLEEIRRRSGEGARPEDERNYLKRLLDLF
jgi:uncharacterized protein (TIGR02302 family)